MDLQQWIKDGVDNNYLIFAEGKLRLTNRVVYDRDNSSSSGGSPSVGLPAIIKRQSGLSQRSSIGDIGQLYKQFQIDTQMPYRLPSGDGKEYTVRTKSDKAVIKLASILNNPEIDYRVLALSARYYYANKNLYRKPLSKWFEEDIWEAYYDEVVELARQGKLENQINQIVSPTSKFGKSL